MLNIEKYKNEIEKIGIGNLATNERGTLEKCTSVPCSFCAFNPDNSAFVHGCDGKKLDWLCEEYKEPKINWDKDIDWMKVPVDTDVVVEGGDGIYFKRKFAMYLPESHYKYITFDDGKEHNNTLNITKWEYCKLANTGDVEKYRKR